MKLSDQGVDVLCDREGCRTTAYKDSVGVWTIGYGHTSAAGPPTVTSGLTITKEEAKNIFRRDVATFEAAVDKAITKPMIQHEADAYVSMAYNIGAGGFSGSTTVKKFNAGDKAGAAEAMLMWNKPPEIMDRRRGEYYQFKGTACVARCPASGPPAGAPKPTTATEPTPIGEAPEEAKFDFTSVEGLQRILYELGYGVKIDGKYGPQTGGALAKACDNGHLLKDANA